MELDISADEEDSILVEEGNAEVEDLDGETEDEGSSDEVELANEEDCTLDEDSVDDEELVRLDEDEKDGLSSGAEENSCDENVEEGWNVELEDGVDELVTGEVDDDSSEEDEDGEGVELSSEVDSIDVGSDELSVEVGGVDGELCNEEVVGVVVLVCEEGKLFDIESRLNVDEGGLCRVVDCSADGGKVCEDIVEVSEEDSAADVVDAAVCSDEDWGIWSVEKLCKVDNRVCESGFSDDLKLTTDWSGRAEGAGAPYAVELSIGMFGTRPKYMGWKKWFSRMGVVEKIPPTMTAATESWNCYSPERDYPFLNTTIQEGGVYVVALQARCEKFKSLRCRARKKEK